MEDGENEPNLPGLVNMQTTMANHYFQQELLLSLSQAPTVFDTVLGLRNKKDWW